MTTTTTKRHPLDGLGHTIEGRHMKGALVADYQGNVWRVATRGIRYHEDVSSCIYGVRPARAPKEYRATQELRAAIATVLSTGTDTPESRSAYDGQHGEVLLRWQDAKADSAWIDVYEGGLLRAVRPHYDDSPSISWLHDERLAAKVHQAAAIAPKPYHLSEVSVRERTTRVEITEDHPRFSAYATARGANLVRKLTETAPVEAIVLPVTEYRRIRAELDGADGAAD